MRQTYREMSRELPALRLTCRQFKDLLEYSGSFPTGTTIGKRWKRHDGVFDRRPNAPPPVWIIGEYYDIGIKDKIGIRWYRPVVSMRAATQ